MYIIHFFSKFLSLMRSLFLYINNTSAFSILSVLLRFLLSFLLFQSLVLSSQHTLLFIVFLKHGFISLVIVSYLYYFNNWLCLLYILCYLQYSWCVVYFPTFVLFYFPKTLYWHIMRSCNVKYINVLQYY